MTRIAVFGEMLVDQFATGAVVGGAPFNVARHLAAFGHAPLMISAVGLDAIGQMVLAEMDKFAMTRSGVQTMPDKPTGVVEVEMHANGDHSFHICSDSAWDSIARTRAQAAIAALDPTGWLYQGTLALRSPDSRSTGLGLMQSHRGPIYLDLNWRAGHVPQEVAMQALVLADTLKVNDHELAMLCDWLGVATGEETSVGDSARALLRELPLNRLFVTCGAQGSWVFEGDGQVVVQARNSRAVHPVDTVGAGDAFSAVTLVGLLRGWDMDATVQRANTFAGNICEVRGAVPSDRDAYRQWTAGWPLHALASI